MPFRSPSAGDSSEPMTRRFRLVVAYDGTDFHGWQESAGVRTVAGEIRQALVPVSRGGEIDLEGASRTDTGVHALGQVVLVSLETNLDADPLARALAARTPPDISIVSCSEVLDDFHPRFDAIGKRYLYRIWKGERAPLFEARNCWWVNESLDIEAMNQAASFLVGRHCFAAFRNRSKDEPQDTTRTLAALDVRARGDWVWVQSIGDGFLYRMVRNLVGTLVDVGRGAPGAQEVKRILASGDRREGGRGAPPQGLFLMEVGYPLGPPLEVRDHLPRF